MKYIPHSILDGPRPSSMSSIMYMFVDMNHYIDFNKVHEVAHGSDPTYAAVLLKFNL